MVNSSTGAARRVGEGPLHGGLGAIVREPDKYVVRFRLSWMAKSGSGFQKGQPPAVEPPVFVPPCTVPDTPGWAGGGTTDGTAAGS